MIDLKEKWKKLFLFQLHNVNCSLTHCFTGAMELNKGYVCNLIHDILYKEFFFPTTWVERWSPISGRDRSGGPRKDQKPKRPPLQKKTVFVEVSSHFVLNFKSSNDLTALFLTFFSSPCLKWTHSSPCYSALTQSSS